MEARAKGSTDVIEKEVVLHKHGKQQGLALCIMRTQDIFLREPSPESTTIVTILHYNVVRDKEENEESIFLLNCFLCRLCVKYIYIL